MTSATDQPAVEVYSVEEIAQAAGVPVSSVEALISSGRLRSVSPLHPFFRLDQAVAAVHSLRAGGRGHSPGFLFDQPRFVHAPARLPVAVSSTFHAGIAAAIVFISTVGFPQASAREEIALEKIPTRLVFLATPGPGGGGGGGGLRQKTPPPKALRK